MAAGRVGRVSLAGAHDGSWGGASLGQGDYLRVALDTGTRSTPSATVATSPDVVEAPSLDSTTAQQPIAALTSPPTLTQSFRRAAYRIVSFTSCHARWSARLNTIRGHGPDFAYSSLFFHPSADGTCASFSHKSNFNFDACRGRGCVWRCWRSSNRTLTLSAQATNS